MRGTHRLLGNARALAALAAAALPALAPGHETDQYTLPLDRPFADIADLLDATHCRAIERATRNLNEQVAGALRDPDPGSRAAVLARVRDPMNVANAVSDAFNDAFFEILDIERALRSSWAGAMYPGQETAYQTVNWIYTYTHLPIDPRRLVLLFPSSTVKAYGVYFGTDKLSHFHHLGRMYFGSYLARRRMGMSEEDAVASTLREYIDGPVSERAFVGFFATGVYSNADMAANFAGMKFYRNLTEPVVLRGEVSPPLLIRVGEFWQVNVHVRPESGWFGAFVSDHWNEALNPNLYDWGVRESVAWLMRDRSERIVTFYVDIDGRPSDPMYYEELASSLSRYYGEEYGHCGRPERLLTIANTCLPVYARRRASEALAGAMGKEKPEDPVGTQR